MGLNQDAEFLVQNLKTRSLWKHSQVFFEHTPFDNTCQFFVGWIHFSKPCSDCVGFYLSIPPLSISSILCRVVEDPRLGFEPRTFFLEGNSAINCGTVKPGLAFESQYVMFIFTAEVEKYIKM